MIKVVDILENLSNRFVNAFACSRYVYESGYGRLFISECLRIRPSHVELTKLCMGGCGHSYRNI